MVLHQNTGHVSPQFHVKFDPSFHTVQQDKLDCTWQQATYFVQPPPTKQPTKQAKQPKTTPQTQPEQANHREAEKTSRYSSMNRVHINERMDPRMDPRQQQKPTEPTIMTARQSQVQCTNVQHLVQSAHITQSPQQGSSLCRSQ